ncbi:MAG TPA: hypothetical protein EYN06_04850 [Myxococcales bacterium]|nr:hypothetical protein [Myxococcales bacterium]
MNSNDSTQTPADLRPFQRDPITRFFVDHPAYITMLTMIGFYALGALAAAADGTFWEIPNTTPPYPTDHRLIPFVREPFTATLLLGIAMAALLYVRVLSYRIVRDYVHLCDGRFLKMSTTSRQQQTAALQRRYDHPIALIFSLLFAGWLVTLEALARSGKMGDELGVTMYGTADVSTFSFIWIAFVTAFCSHVFISTLYRIVITCVFINTAFDNDSEIELQPIHPDECCGLRFVGNLTLFMSFFVVFWPLMLTSVGFFFPEFLAFPAFRYGLMYAGGLFYIGIASVVFLMPTLPVHRIMDKSREEALTLLTERFLGTYNSIFERLHQAEIDRNRLDEEVKLLANIKTLITEVKARGIWPFNLTVVIRFVTVVMVPLVPIYFEFLA